MRWHPSATHEMRVAGELKAEGVIKSAYRRGAGPGVYLILEGSSNDSGRERLDTLSLCLVEGLMTLDYDEIYGI